MKKKILIIGGTGFIGKHLITKCLSLKWKVTSVSTKRPKLPKKNVKYIICDISKFKNIKLKIKKNFDYVVNLGGYVDHSNKIKTYNSHYIGVKNLCNYFKNTNIENFLQLGSSLEYGNLASPHKENYLCYPKKLKTTYAKSKLLATRYLLKFNKKYKFPSSIIRLYLAYGPKQDINRLIPIIIKACLNNKTFDCSNGNQFRDFIYIDDLITLIIKILKNKKSIGQIFNAGSGKKRQVKKIIHKIISICKGGQPNFGAIKLRKDEINILYPSISKAKKLLSWEPKTKFNKGLNKTISYYKKL